MSSSLAIVLAVACVLVLIVAVVVVVLVVLKGRSKETSAPPASAQYGSVPYENLPRPEEGDPAGTAHTPDTLVVDPAQGQGASAVEQAADPAGSSQAEAAAQHSPVPPPAPEPVVAPEPPPAPEPTPAGQPTPAPEPEQEQEQEQEQAPVVHAPSDDVEMTTRISRPAATPVSDLSAAEPKASWASAIPVEPDQTSSSGHDASPWRTADPDPIVVDTPDHTYWDDEEAAQAQAIETQIADDSTAETTEPAPSSSDDGSRPVADGGFGWGSAAPFADGSQPPGHPIKGHREWMQYHEPGSPWYEETTVDVWFVDAATAERAGFRRA